MKSSNSMQFHSSNPLTLLSHDKTLLSKHSQFRSFKKPKNRRVHFEINNNKETLKITRTNLQEQKKVHCVVNISKMNKKTRRLSSKSCNGRKGKIKSSERIIPLCCREKCNSHNTLTKIKKTCQRSAAESRRQNCHENQNKTDVPECMSFSLTSSPISITCNELNDYEDISSVERFSSSDEDIEILIRRTRERDRKSNVSLNLPTQPRELSSPYLNIESEDENGVLNNERESNASSNPQSKLQDASSPYTIIESDDDRTVFTSDMDISLHSQATLVLDPLSNDLYSPTASPIKMDFDSDTNHTDDLNYSPINNNTYNHLFHQKFESDIKKEIYSPTHEFKQEKNIEDVEDFKIFNTIDSQNKESKIKTEIY